MPKCARGSPKRDMHDKNLFMKPGSLNNNQRFISAIPEWSRRGFDSINPVIGVLPGEGIGPEIIDVTLDILDLVNQAYGNQFKVLMGGKIGLPAQAESGRTLTQEVIDFCQSIFSRKGAILKPHQEIRKCHRNPSASSGGQ